MQFIDAENWQSGIDSLYSRLEKALSEGHHVLWLLTGGSSVAASVAVMGRLDSQLTPRLTVMLGDERFVPIGDPHSNATQLQMAGFNPKRATVVPVLIAGLSLAETRVSYEKLALDAFQQAAVIIGQFGIGDDGHIAGILPESPATDTTEFVAAYIGPDYARLTLTAHALKRLTLAYAFVFGDSKAEALTRLHDLTLPYHVQPSQILKELPEAYVYNDQIGDTI